jgi:hypothetical protein
MKTYGAIWPHMFYISDLPPITIVSSDVLASVLDIVTVMESVSCMFNEVLENAEPVCIFIHVNVDAFFNTIIITAPMPCTKPIIIKEVYCIGPITIGLVDDNL